MKIRLNRNRWRAGFLAFQFLGGAIQKKTKVPRVTPIDPSAEAGKAIAGNIQNFDETARLGGLYNQYAQNAIMQGLKSTLGPDVTNILGQGTKNILSLLRGELPQDVQNRVQDFAAAKAFGGGFQDSGMQHALTLRDFGRTSLEAQAAGQAQAVPWFGLGRQLSPTFDVSNMFVTPAQQIAVALENQARQFSASWLKAQVKQAQAWETILGQAIIKTDDQIMEIATSALGAYLGGGLGAIGGGMGGGGGGGGGYNPPKTPSQYGR